MKNIKIMGITCLLILFFVQTLHSQSFEIADPEESEESYLYNLGLQFVEALNADSDEKADSLMHLVFVKGSADGLAAILREDFKDVKFGTIRVMLQHKVVHIVVQKKNGDWHNFQMGTVEGPPRRGKRLAIVLAAKPAKIPKGSIRDRKVQEAINSYVAELDKEGQLYGSLMIASGNKPLVEKYFGLANSETKKAIDKDTPIGMASSSKMFTSVAVLKLIQEGKLSLEDKLSQFVSEYTDKEFAENVTIAQLLSHQSGVPDYWDNAYEKEWHAIEHLDQYLPFIINKPKEFEPGEGNGYSNSNFILLGLIVERVTGESYFEHVQQEIFDPLKMNNTGFYKNTNERIAIGYLDLGDQLIKERGGLMGSAAGGAYSTVSDMLKFSQALRSYQLISKETLDMATEERVSIGGYLPYGYGFIINDNFSSSFGHGGFGPGSGMAFAIDKTSDLTFILMSNNPNGAYSELLFSINAVLAHN